MRQVGQPITLKFTSHLCYLGNLCTMKVNRLFKDKLLSYQHSTFEFTVWLLIAGCGSCLHHICQLWQTSGSWNHVPTSCQLERGYQNGGVCWWAYPQHTNTKVGTAYFIYLFYNALTTASVI